MKDDFKSYESSLTQGPFIGFLKILNAKYNLKCKFKCKI